MFGLHGWENDNKSPKQNSLRQAKKKTAATKGSTRGSTIKKQQTQKTKKGYQLKS
jgi:hypothetical protein